VAVPRVRAGGKWTEAQYKGFIRSALRKAWTRWGPNNQTKKDARVERGIYKCAGYKRRAHKVPASVKEDGKRKNNVFTDHIDPVVDPVVGFVDWDTFISRLFCETENLQVLCKQCHDLKTQDEKNKRKKV
jgi:hypothetical protein